MYGWRARIGAVFGPAVAETSVAEFYRLAPEGVSLVLITLGISEVTPENLTAGFGLMDRAVAELAKRKPDVMILGGAPAIREAALGQDEQIAARYQTQTGIPTMTSQTASMSALRSLGARRLVVASPHGERQTGLLRQLLGANGFQVVAAGGLDLPLEGFNTLPAHAMYRLIADLVRQSPDAEAAYVPSPSAPCPYLAEIEADLGLPVVTQNSALLWAGLHRLHLRLHIPNQGRLLDSLAKAL